MPEKNTEEMIKELYYTFNPTGGVKTPIERIFIEIESVKKAAVKLPCQNPEAPCPKNVTALSLTKKTGGMIIGTIGAIGYGFYELFEYIKTVLITK